MANSEIVKKSLEEEIMEKMSSDEIQYLRDFLMSHKKIKDFRKEHAEIFATLDELGDIFNKNLAVADTIIRKYHIPKCGPFIKLYSWEDINCELLCKRIGRRKFKKLGGKLKRVTQYSIDKDRFFAAKASGRISQELMVEVCKTIVHYKKIKEVCIP